MVSGWKEQSEWQGLAELDGGRRYSAGNGGEKIHLNAPVGVGGWPIGLTMHWWDSLSTLVREWGLSDHSAIGGVVRVDALAGVGDNREAIDRDPVVLTVAD